MSNRDYSGYDDKHAKSRDRKSAKRAEGKLMRGNRSVFEIQKAQAKRDRNTIRRMQSDENEK